MACSSGCVGVPSPPPPLTAASRHAPAHLHTPRARQFPIPSSARPPSQAPATARALRDPACPVPTRVCAARRLVAAAATLAGAAHAQGAAAAPELAPDVRAPALAWTSAKLADPLPFKGGPALAHSAEDRAGRVIRAAVHPCYTYVQTLHLECILHAHDTSLCTSYRKLIPSNPRQSGRCAKIRAGIVRKHGTVFRPRFRPSAPGGAPSRYHRPSRLRMCYRSEKALPCCRIFMHTLGK